MEPGEAGQGWRDRFGHHRHPARRSHRSGGIHSGRECGQRKQMPAPKGEASAQGPAPLEMHDRKQRTGGRRVSKGQTQDRGLGRKNRNVSSGVTTRRPLGVRTGVRTPPREGGKALPPTPAVPLPSALLSRSAATPLPVAHRGLRGLRAACAQARTGGAGELQRGPGLSRAQEGQVTPCLALLAYS